ncbi:tetratricopeptide repeat protein [Neolewinella lacunae]|uniref:Tetratricopeptide repeat protein n=1 Tax=Neolewinella lacunae TaxID=1517758 RepID=A0A923TEJ0_9BACT|nr:tetratricopeptide repeat protein [Neolewinella lacunae]MBC6995967.1 tetratricopeptide repeat protein [Neolewinella lacunae]MDN3635189.1 tetratricopeptide repeat protein [Neolewinella lacunae]
MKHLTRFFLLLLAFQVLVSSCSSTKRRDEQGPMAKLWHNMNSHYNGYFNAEELMAATLLTLEEQHVDNYTQRLKMFPFLEVENTSSVNGDLDKAIEKVALVVKKHPYSNWVDDSYLLIGQAQLIKQDYESAEKTFRFLVNEFRPRPQRKKSKARKGAAEPEEDAFVSRRDVETNPEQERKERLRAREDARKEKEKIRRQQEKERKAENKRREKERKARIKARKRGIKLAPIVRDTTGLRNEPEEEPAAEEEALGPVGMISIFSKAADLGTGTEAYGKKPDSYLIKHRPAFQEGRLWLAWSLIKRDNFDQAQIILEDLRADRGTFPDVRRKAMAVQAYLYLEQNNPEQAIPYLEEAAEVAEERNERARFHYIAGQLQQELGQPAGAAAAFEKAIAAKPAYELELGARLNLAQNEFLSGSGSAAEAIKKLERMAKEEKNLPYESQILFSIAALALRSGDAATGAAYLQRALASASAGPIQQLEAYKMLGDLAYADGDYLPAKLYYDSTLTVMGKTDERYAPLASRRDQLTGIAGYLQDIQLKDSLLRIGTLPVAQRDKWAKDLFEARRAAAAAPVNPVASAGQRGNLASNSVGASDFFAYNPSAVKKGKRDFERRWGERNLEDNWRRSQRTDAGLFEAEGDGTQGDPSAEEVSMITEDEIKGILQGIPTEETAQTTMRIQLAENWFNLGREYRDKLENNDKALEAFATLNERYPAANAEAESWYYQFLIHREMGNATKAAEFAKLLSGKYRGSKFDQLANDPTYASTLLAKEDQLMRDYEVAYAAFERGEYQLAFDLAAKGRGTLLGQHPLKPRYALLLAMATGNLQGRPAYIAELRQVVAQFDNTPEQTRAKEILRLLGETGSSIPGQANVSIGGGFKESMKEAHYLIIVFDKEDTDLNAAKVAVSEFNNKYYKLDRLRVTNVYLGDNNSTPVLVLRKYLTGTEAMQYFQTAREKEQEFLDAGKYSYDLFAVSQSNYREVLKARSIEDYKPWFRENYE